MIMSGNEAWNRNVYNNNVTSGFYTCVCEQLAQGCYLKVERPGLEPATFDDALTITSDILVSARR